MQHSLKPSYIKHDILLVDIEWRRGSSTWSLGGSNEPPELNQKKMIIIFFILFFLF